MESASDDTTRFLPPRRALADDVYDAVLGLLMDKVIEPGSRASIDGIARQLGVSPTPVREALARLESEGLVSKRALRGYSAAELLDQEGLRQLFEMRALLEPEAARLAAARLTPDALDELGSLVWEMRAEADSPISPGDDYRSYREFAQRDADFHRLIAEHSGNVLLSDAVVRLRSHMHIFRLYFKHGIAREASLEHQTVLEALRRGEPEDAQERMREHINSSFARISKHL